LHETPCQLDTHTQRRTRT